MKNYFSCISGTLPVISLCWAIAAHAQIATGGTYKLEQAVIAGGGGTSSDAVNSLYKVEGTIGQHDAHARLTGGPPNYSLRPAFWNEVPIVTAAGVSVSGRVSTASGRGVTNALVEIVGGTLTAPRRVLTGRNGQFTFTDIEAGHVYVVTVSSRRFAFAQPSQAISVVDEVSGLNFTATPN